MIYKETQNAGKESQHKDFPYRTMAAIFFAISLYLMGLTACHFDEIGEPWNFIATLTLGICNGLLSFYFYGDPEKPENED